MCAANTYMFHVDAPDYEEHDDDPSTLRATADGRIAYLPDLWTYAFTARGSADAAVCVAEAVQNFVGTVIHSAVVRSPEGVDRVGVWLTRELGVTLATGNLRESAMRFSIGAPDRPLATVAVSPVGELEMVMYDADMPDVRTLLVPCGAAQATGLQATGPQATGPHAAREPGDPRQVADAITDCP